jgi:hypothetical protein
MKNDIVIRQTIASIVDARATALSEYQGMMQCAERVKKTLAQTGPYLCPYFDHNLSTAKEFTRELDARLWRHAFALTGLDQFFDAKARREFDESIERSPPAFTEENARSALLSAAADADKMFVRGLVEVFLRLSKQHRTNTDAPFEIGRKVILGYAVDAAYTGGLRLRHHYGESQINDIDRVMKILDGREFKANEVHNAVNQAFGKMEPYEDDFYKMRGYASGTLHLTFKRADLLAKANRMIGDYYHGRALANAA